MMTNNINTNYQPYPKMGMADRGNYFTRLMIFEIFDAIVLASLFLLESIFDNPVFFTGATVGNSSGLIL